MIDTPGRIFPFSLPNDDIFSPRRITRSLFSSVVPAGNAHGKCDQKRIRPHFFEAGTSSNAPTRMFWFPGLVSKANHSATIAKYGLHGGLWRPRSCRCNCLLIADDDDDGVRWSHPFHVWPWCVFLCISDSMHLRWQPRLHSREFRRRLIPSR